MSEFPKGLGNFKGRRVRKTPCLLLWGMSAAGFRHYGLPSKMLEWMSGVDWICDTVMTNSTGDAKNEKHIFWDLRPARVWDDILQVIFRGPQPELISINIFAHLADHQSCPDISFYFFAGCEHQPHNHRKQLPLHSSFMEKAFAIYLLNIQKQIGNRKSSGNNHYSCH